MKLTIFGQPITAKNSLNLVDIGKQCPYCRRKAKSIPLPSKAFKTYEKNVKEQLRLMSYKMILGPVWVKCLYYMETARMPDLCNLLEGTHDILERCGLIENDRLIKSVDGSRIIGKDPDPRVEIEIKEMP
jgi:Holliday junction resolvase RusA-like endonuclease